MARAGKAALLAAAAVGGAWALGELAYRQVLYRDRAGDEALLRAERARIEARYARRGEPSPWAWKADHPPVWRGVRAFDGTALMADEYPAAADTHRWAVTVHGYHSCADGMLRYTRLFHELGFHVLAPDLRGHGRSAGDYAGMGGHDRLDVLRWIDWILERDPQAEILLHGMSMGAATVLLAAGETLPKGVRCVVEDCGYSAAEDAVAHVLRRRKIPCPGAVVALLRQTARRKAGYDLADNAPERALARCRIPVLLIHGVDDPVVPFYMAAKLLSACPGEAEFYPVPGAGHTGAFEADPEEYARRVAAFVRRCF